jgi:uncharacterized protein
MYNTAIGSSHETPVDIDQIVIDDLTVRSLKSMVRLSRTREGLLMQVKADGEVVTSCVRCLREIYLPVEAEFEELYQFPSRHREETDLLLPHDGYLDLRPIYREYLILAIPIKRLCEINCLGLCAVCGANLNETTCEHHPEEAAPIQPNEQEAR